MGVLTDARVRAARAGGAAYKLSDGGQMYLHVLPTGGRIWRMNYQFGVNAKGRPAQKTLTIGAYPAISLKDAREARDFAKSMLAKGIEPKPEALFQRGAPEANRGPTFEKIARDWHRLQAKRWSKVHAGDVIDSLDNEVFPKIGARPIGEIDATAVFSVLSEVAERGAIETAHRIRQRISAIFVYGIALGHAKNDPAGNLSIALPRKPKSKPQPAVTDLNALRQLIVDCEAERCRPATKLAMRFLALTAVRSNELNGARWTEFEDLDGPEPLWRIPARRMKGDEDHKAELDGDHLVPLVPASVAILRCMKQFSGDLALVWPSDRHAHRQMSENTLRALLIRAGYYQRHVPHGFRAAFSTLMNEWAERAWRRAGHEGISPDRAIIDLMLAHAPKREEVSHSEGAYNRAEYMARRRELAQVWADMLLADMWPPEIQMGQPMKWAANGPGRPR